MGYRSNLADLTTELLEKALNDNMEKFEKANDRAKVYYRRLVRKIEIELKKRSPAIKKMAELKGVA